MADFKFKIGDKVRVLNGSNILGYTAGWDPETVGKYVGKVMTVKEPSIFDNNRKSYYLEGSIFTFDERGLELVEKKISKNFIEWANKKYSDFMDIYRNTKSYIRYSTDRATWVSVYNSRTGKFAKSYCSSNDTFNRHIGIAIAWARYLKEEIPPMYDNNKYKITISSTKTEKEIFYPSEEELVCAFCSEIYKTPSEINADIISNTLKAYAQFGQGMCYNNKSERFIISKY